MRAEQSRTGHYVHSRTAERRALRPSSRSEPETAIQPRPINHVAVATISKFDRRFRKQSIYVGKHKSAHLLTVDDWIDWFISTAHENSVDRHRNDRSIHIIMIYGIPKPCTNVGYDRTGPKTNSYSTLRIMSLLIPSTETRPSLIGRPKTAKF